MGKIIGYKRLAEENDQLRAQVRQLEQRVFSRRKLAVKTSMVKNLQQDAQKLVEREKALNGRQGVILAKENALGAEKARLVAVAKDSVYYEQEASSLLVENEKLQNKLAEKDQTIGELNTCPLDPLLSGRLRLKVRKRTNQTSKGNARASVHFLCGISYIQFALRISFELEAQCSDLPSRLDRRPVDQPAVLLSELLHRRLDDAYAAVLEIL